MSKHLCRVLDKHHFADGGAKIPGGVMPRRRGLRRAKMYTSAPILKQDGVDFTPVDPAVRGLYEPIHQMRPEIHFTVPLTKHHTREVTYSCTATSSSLP